MKILSDLASLSYDIGIGLLLYAAVHDVMARTVPNWTNGSIVVLALPIRILQGNLEPALFFSLAVFWLLLLLWRLRLLGGGDVKLWVAATLLVPPFWQNEYLALERITLIGGLLALLYITQRHFLKFKILVFKHPRNRYLWQRSIQAELWRMRRGGPLPYAVAISTGILITLWPTF
jgi:prepilin peptidase CpaA